MTEAQRRTSLVAQRMVRLWPVVLVAALVGALLMGWTAYSSAPSLPWEGKAAIRVVNQIGSPMFPQPATAVAIALQPAVREKAVTQAGVDAGRVGPVLAAVDAKDSAVVNVTVSAADSDAALRVAEELRAIVTSETLRAVSPSLDFWTATRDAYRQTAGEMAGVAADAEARLLADPENTDLKSLLLGSTVQVRGMTEAARNAQYQLDLWTAGVTPFGEPSSAPLDTKRPLMVGALQGAVLGAVIGLMLIGAVAAYRVWREPDAPSSEG